MAGYYVFFRCWPGFTEPFPFERFNGLSEEELGSALESFAIEQLQTAEVRGRIKQIGRQRRGRFPDTAALKRQSSKRMVGPATPALSPRKSVRQEHWERVRCADRKDPLVCRLGAYLGWWHSEIVGLSGPVVPRIWFHETRSREFAEQLVVELNAGFKLAKLDYYARQLEYHANPRPGFISAEGLSDGQRASIWRCIQAIQEGREPAVEYGKLVLPIGQRALTVALDLAKAWPVEEDKELLAALPVPPSAAKAEQGNGNGRSQMEPPQDFGKKATHSPDFRSVNWFGTEHGFTPNQATVVAALWGAWEKGSPDIGDSYLIEFADSNSARLDLVFRGNSAWGTTAVRL